MKKGKKTPIVSIVCKNKVEHKRLFFSVFEKQVRPFTPLVSKSIDSILFSFHSLVGSVQHESHILWILSILSNFLGLNCFFSKPVKSGEAVE